jgi:hypothetical protein
MDLEFDVYEEWKPIEVSTGSIDMRSLCHEVGKLILLFDEWPGKNPFKIVFESYFAYRVTVESGRMKSLNNPTLKMFNSSKNSEYLTWFRDESGEIYNNLDIIQYTILYQDGITDIITSCSPWAERII